MIQESESDVDDVETVFPNNRNRILPPKPAQINTRVTTNQRKRKFTDGKSTTQPNKRKRTVKHRIVCGENDQSKPTMSQSMSPIRVPYDPQPVRKRMQATRHFPCRDYYGRGYCLRGNNCLFDHGLNPIVVKDSELDYFKVFSIFNPNPPPPGLEEKPQQRQDVYLHSQQITSAAALVQSHCAALLTVGGTVQTTLPNHMIPYDRFPLENAWLQEMEAQNERLKSESERNTARLGLVQLCRLTKDLYEKSVEQQKLLLRKLQKLNNDKMKRQQAKALIKKSEDMAKKAKCELEEMFRRLTE
uniref:C3H1-type domain-containing protein n=1 Tax=Globodera rostochiensis TaxID=31243 RepID=A0A914HU18_GLORO